MSYAIYGLKDSDQGIKYTQGQPAEVGKKGQVWPVVKFLDSANLGQKIGFEFYFSTLLSEHNFLIFFYFHLFL